MRLTKFILIAAGVFILNSTNLSADDAKMAKGLEVFNETAACAACHILKAAGSEGNVGPNLDTVEMTKESLTEMVVYGLGVMPAFGEDEILNKEEIDAVVHYVLNSAGK